MYLGHESTHVKRTGSHDPQLMDCLRETDCFVNVVEYGVVLTHEDVSQDPLRSGPVGVSRDIRRKW